MLRHITQIKGVIMIAFLLLLILITLLDGWGVVETLAQAVVILLLHILSTIQGWFV